MSVRCSTSISQSPQSPQLEALHSLIPCLATNTELTTQLCECVFSPFPSLYETDLLLLSTRIFPGQHLASNDRLFRSCTTLLPMCSVFLLPMCPVCTLPAPTPAGDKPPHYIGLGEIVADFWTDVLPRGIDDSGD